MSERIIVKNPHSILAALERRPDDIFRLVLPSEPKDAWVRVAQLAQKLRITVGEESGPTRDRDRDRGGHGRRSEQRKEGGRESAAHAEIAAKESISIEELFETTMDGSSEGGLWLALDSLQDPQNVGSIFRTAGFFGVRGIIFTAERSAPITGTVYDVSCGGVESIPFVEQINLQRAFEKAKDKGLWILGTSEHAKQTLKEVKKDRNWLLVLGNEEKGMRRLTEENCDVTVKVAPQGDVTSLNVSVAAGICIAHLS